MRFHVEYKRPCGHGVPYSRRSSRMLRRSLIKVSLLDTASSRSDTLWVNHSRSRSSSLMYAFLPMGFLSTSTADRECLSLLYFWLLRLHYGRSDIFSARLTSACTSRHALVGNARLLVCLPAIGHETPCPAHCRNGFQAPDERGYSTAGCRTCVEQ